MNIVVEVYIDIPVDDYPRWFNLPNLDTISTIVELKFACLDYISTIGSRIGSGCTMWLMG